MNPKDNLEEVIQIDHHGQAAHHGQIACRLPISASLLDACQEQDCRRKDQITHAAPGQGESVYRVFSAFRNLLAAELKGSTTHSQPHKDSQIGIQIVGQRIVSVICLWKRPNHHNCGHQPQHLCQYAAAKNMKQSIFRRITQLIADSFHHSLSGTPPPVYLKGSWSKAPDIPD